MYNRAIKIFLIGARGRQCKNLLSYDVSDLNIDFIAFEHRKGQKFDKSEYPKYCSSITTIFEDILDCDAVMIFSPNNTHHEYIKNILDLGFIGYIFCEKPAAVSKEGILYLNCLSDSIKSRILFGFNLRYSIYNEYFENKKLGKLQLCTIYNTHGLGYKESYKNSWRNSKTENSLGVVETVLIHYIDLFINAIGMPNKEMLVSSIQSPWGNTIEAIRCLL